MRKIISILVALGLVLAFSAVALPTSAANTCNGTVTMDDDCAGATATYTINFTIPVTLLPGNDLLSVTFGAGTSLASVNSSYVALNGTNPTSVTISGTHLEFPLPGAAMILAGSSLQLVIQNVVNPAGGDYNLVLDYKLVCCPAVDFCTVAYHINLAEAEYSLAVDFDDTYPGIALDFVPPFKACGQNDTADFNTTLIGGLWFDPFDLIVVVEEEGCDVPCENATLFIDVTKFPSTTAKVTLNITGTSNVQLTFNSTAHNSTLPGFVALDESVDTVLQSYLHFSEKGDYTIYFKLYCPGQGSGCPLCLPAVDAPVASGTYDFAVYQWKDAAKIILQEKWNLISLPLVPLVDPPIADLLASIEDADLAKILSIWNYECTTGKWFVWPTPGAGQQALTEMVDGKAYWMRVVYPFSTTACGNITWWVWGTVKPMPPAAPAEYEVCDGWNMVGFLGTVADVPFGAGKYLWNWATADVVIYGWDQGCWNVQNWNLITGSEQLVPGQGYWMAFNGAGSIFVP